MDPILITFDSGTRDRVLRETGLDFSDTAGILSGSRFEFEDRRSHPSEKRRVTVGHLAGRMLVVIWAERDRDCHVLAMRKANVREQGRYGPFIR